MAYELNIPTAFAGLKVDSMFDHVESFAAQNNVNFGYAVGAPAGDTRKVRQVAENNAEIDFDADFITANEINGTVNGVAIAPVTFATDHATTRAAVVAAYNALAGVSAVAAAGRAIDVTMDDGSAITVTCVVAGGVSQPTVTIGYSSDDVVRGIALHQHNEAKVYQDTDTVSVLRKGKVWGEVGVAVTADEAVYIDTTGRTSKFTNVVGANRPVPGAIFRSSTAAAGIAQIEINLP